MKISIKLFSKRNADKKNEKKQNQQKKLMNK